MKLQTSLMVRSDLWVMVPTSNSHSPGSVHGLKGLDFYCIVKRCLAFSDKGKDLGRPVCSLHIKEK